MWDALKIIFTTAFGCLITFLEPVYNPIMVLAYVFVADIFFGIMVDLIINDDRLRLKKFILSVAFLALYTSIIASTYVIGKLMGDEKEALYLVKSLTYVFILFYVSNTFRNLKLLFPHNKPIAFLYYIFGLQILKKLPLLAKFLGLTPDKEDKKNNNI